MRNQIKVWVIIESTYIISTYLYADFTGKKVDIFGIILHVVVFSGVYFSLVLYEKKKNKN